MAPRTRRATQSDDKANVSSHRPPGYFHTSYMSTKIFSDTLSHFSEPFLRRETDKIFVICRSKLVRPFIRFCCDKKIDTTSMTRNIQSRNKNNEFDWSFAFRDYYCALCRSIFIYAIYLLTRTCTPSFEHRIF